MEGQEELITNTSYESLFSADTSLLRRDHYVTPGLGGLASTDSARVTLSLGLLLQKADTNNSSLYGVEITCSGKGRNIRIPLVRISDKTQTIWKVVNDIKKLERALDVLGDTIFFLKENNSSDYPIPSKVIVLTEEVGILKDHKDFVNKIAQENSLVVFHITFLKSLIENSNVSQLEEILKGKGSVNLNS